MIILRLDRMLAERKISSKELAERVGISQVNMSRIKTGKVSAVRFSTLDAICRALDCQPGDVLEYMPDDEADNLFGLKHRYQVLKTSKRIYQRENGLLPVVVIDKELSNRMASTIRHNRARGTHNIELMCHIVAELDRAGMSDEWIMKNIGMDRDEVLRLKQISGLADLFANKNFSIPDKKEEYVADK